MWKLLKKMFKRPQASLDMTCYSRRWALVRHEMDTKDVWV
jgi:hypothetical protein